MKNRLCKSVSNKYVLVSENVDVSDVVQTEVDHIFQMFDISVYLNLDENGKQILEYQETR